MSKKTVGYYSIKVPLSQDKISKCILCKKELTDLSNTIELLGMNKGNYIAMLIVRDLKHRRESGTI